jgi:hypothetical protein
MVWRFGHRPAEICRKCEQWAMNGPHGTVAYNKMIRREAKRLTVAARWDESQSKELVRDV